MFLDRKPSITMPLFNQRYKSDVNRGEGQNYGVLASHQSSLQIIPLACETKRAPIFGFSAYSLITLSESLFARFCFTGVELNI